MFMRKVVKKKQKKNTLQDETHIVRLHGIYDVHIVDAKTSTLFNLVLYEMMVATAVYHQQQLTRKKE